MTQSTRKGRGPAHTSTRKRGRPSKFGQPSRLVAVTLPEQVIQGLRNLHPDLAWAIVALFEKGTEPTRTQRRFDAELISVGDRESLIVVARAAFKRLPGVEIVPLSEDRAFLALEPGCGFGDLETAVARRLENPEGSKTEREALLRLRRQLRAWRRNRAFHIFTRAIIVVERVDEPRKRERRRTPPQS